MSFLLCYNVWRCTTIKFKLLKHFYQVMHSLQLSLNLEWGFRKECNMNLSTRIKKLKIKYSQLMQFQNINLSFLIIFSFTKEVFNNWSVNMFNNLFRAPHVGLKLCKSIGVLCKESAFRRDNTRFDNNVEVEIRTNPVNIFMQNRYVYNNICLLVYHKILSTYFLS